MSAVPAGVRLTPDASQAGSFNEDARKEKLKGEGESSPPPGGVQREKTFLDRLGGLLTPAGSDRAEQPAPQSYLDTFRNEPEEDGSPAGSFKRKLAEGGGGDGKAVSV